MLVSLSRTIAIALLLTACSVPPVFYHLPGLQHMSQEESLASYYQWLARADAEALQDARESYQRAADASPEERLRHALLLSFDDNAPTDDLQTATSLMTEVLEEHPELPSRHADFALLWNDMLYLRLELRETMARQADSIDSLRQRNEELARQIEALTIIEQQLNQRERQEPES